MSLCRYYSRQFQRYKDRKNSARMTGVPQLGVPDILVDDEEQRAKSKQSLAAPQNPYSPRVSAGAGSSRLRSSTATYLSPHEARNSGGSSSQHQKAWSGPSTDLTIQTNFDNSGVHPLSRPRSGDSTTSVGRNSEAHASTHSAFSFELQPSGSATSSAPGSRRGSRSNSAVSPIQMSQILDDSIWMATIRRSATSLKKKPGW